MSHFDNFGSQCCPGCWAQYQTEAEADTGLCAQCAVTAAALSAEADASQAALAARAPEEVAADVAAAEAALEARAARESAARHVSHTKWDDCYSTAGIPQRQEEPSFAKCRECGSSLIGPEKAAGICNWCRRKN